MPAEVALVMLNDRYTGCCVAMARFCAYRMSLITVRAADSPFRSSCELMPANTMAAAIAMMITTHMISIIVNARLGRSARPLDLSHVIFIFSPPGYLPLLHYPICHRPLPNGLEVSRCRKGR